MADQRRPPPGREPSQRVTAERPAPAPRTTAPMGTGAAKAAAEKRDEPTRAMEPHETSRQPRFVSESSSRRPCRPTDPARAHHHADGHGGVGAAERHPGHAAGADPRGAAGDDGEARGRGRRRGARRRRARPAAHAGVGGDAQAARGSRSPPHPRARARLGGAASFRVLRHRLQSAAIRASSRSPARGARRARPPARSTWRWRSASAAARACSSSKPTCARRRWRRCSASCRRECFSAQMQRHKDKPLEAWSVVEVFSPYLHVLAVKPGEAAARPLLDGPAFSIAIEMLAQAGYDYIIVDTPPVLGAADVNLIEDSADGVSSPRGRARPRRARCAPPSSSSRRPSCSASPSSTSERGHARRAGRLARAPGRQRRAAQPPAPAPPATARARPRARARAAARTRAAAVDQAVPLAHRRSRGPPTSLAPCTSPTRARRTCRRRSSPRSLPPTASRSSCAWISCRSWRRSCACKRRRAAGRRGAPPPCANGCARW